MDRFIEKMKKMDKLISLKYKTGDELVERFMNDENGNMLDEKIKVCERLIKGEKPDDIENYYDVLDDMPRSGGGERTYW